MGNCCRRESAMAWTTVDDWDEEPSPREHHPPLEKECLLACDDGAAPAATTPFKQELVKLKITKRELDELMASARLQDLPMDRLLSKLIGAVDHSHVQRQRSWEPSLHSIAE